MTRLNRVSCKRLLSASIAPCAFMNTEALFYSRNKCLPTLTNDL